VVLFKIGHTATLDAQYNHHHPAGPLEEHLLICGECRDQFQAETDFLTAMRGEVTKIREEEQKEGH
jgi:hypothetical protein